MFVNGVLYRASQIVVVNDGGWMSQAILLFKNVPTDDEARTSLGFAANAFLRLRSA